MNATRRDPQHLKRAIRENEAPTRRSHEGAPRSSSVGDLHSTHASCESGVAIRFAKASVTTGCGRECAHRVDTREGGGLTWRCSMRRVAVVTMFRAMGADLEVLGATPVASSRAAIPDAPSAWTVEPHLRPPQTGLVCCAGSRVSRRRTARPSAASTTPRGSARSCVDNATTLATVASRTVHSTFGVPDPGDRPDTYTGPRSAGFA